MYCPHCGVEVPANSKFCPKCGTPLAVRQQAYQQPAAEQSQHAQPDPSQQSAHQQSQYAQPGPAAPYSQTVQGAQPQGYGVVPQRDNWSTITIVLLNIITCGFYSWWFTHKLAQETNEICNDGENTPGLATYILLGLVTLGIYCYYWEYKIQNRMQANAPRYGVLIADSGGKILMWDILSIVIAFLIGIVTAGIFTFLGFLLMCIPLSILVKSMNKLATGYNMTNGVAYVG